MFISRVVSTDPHNLPTPPTLSEGNARQSRNVREDFQKDLTDLAKRGVDFLCVYSHIDSHQPSTFRHDSFRANGYFGLPIENVDRLHGQELVGRVQQLLDNRPTFNTQNALAAMQATDAQKSPSHVSDPHITKNQPQKALDAHNNIENMEKLNAPKKGLTIGQANGYRVWLSKNYSARFTKEIEPKLREFNTDIVANGVDHCQLTALYAYPDINEIFLRTLIQEPRPESSNQPF